MGCAGYISSLFCCVSHPQVFDFSKSDAGNGRFLPFSETIQLAARYDLPLVGYEYRQKLSPEEGFGTGTEIWADLAAAQTRHYATAPALLEGFVVREAKDGTRIAKARVEQLAAALTETDRSSKAAKPVEAVSTSPAGTTFTSADGFTRRHSFQEHIAITRWPFPPAALHAEQLQWIHFQLDQYSIPLWKRMNSMKAVLPKRQMPVMEQKQLLGLDVKARTHSRMTTDTEGWLQEVPTELLFHILKIRSVAVDVEDVED
eukprot:symbB.v1.2.029037.t1/scaffold3136.1/size62675/3